MEYDCGYWRDNGSGGDFFGRMVVSRSLDVAGDEMDERLCSISQKIQFLIGDTTAEEVKIKSDLFSHF